MLSAGTVSVPKEPASLEEAGKPEENDTPRKSAETRSIRSGKDKPPSAGPRSSGSAAGKATSPTGEKPENDRIGSGKPKTPTPEKTEASQDVAGEEKKELDRFGQWVNSGRIGSGKSKTPTGEKTEPSQGETIEEKAEPDRTGSSNPKTPTNERVGSSKPKTPTGENKEPNRIGSSKPKTPTAENPEPDQVGSGKPKTSSGERIGSSKPKTPTDRVGSSQPKTPPGDRIEPDRVDSSKPRTPVEKDKGAIQEEQPKTPTEAKPEPGRVSSSKPKTPTEEKPGADRVGSSKPKTPTEKENKDASEKPKTPTTEKPEADRIPSSKSSDRPQSAGAQKGEEACEKTKERVDVLESALASGGDFVTDATREAVWKISRCYHEWEGWRVEVYNALVDSKYPELATALSKLLAEEELELDEGSCKFAINYINSLANFSKCGPHLIEKVERKAFDWLFDFLETFIETAGERTDEVAIHFWALLKAILCLLIEATKNNDTMMTELQSDVNVQVLDKLAKLEDRPQITFPAVCCLAYLANGDQLKPNVNDYADILYQSVESALEFVENPNFQSFSLIEVANAFYLMIVKCSAEGDKKKNSVYLSDRVKIPQISEFIVSDNAVRRSHGAILFKANCNLTMSGSWVRPLYYIATMRTGSSDANSVTQQDRAAKASEFLGEYQTWLKERHPTESDEDGEAEPIEAQGFTLQRNEAIKEIEVLKSETRLRVSFLAKMMELSPNSLGSNEIVEVFGLISDSYSEFKNWKEDVVAMCLKEDFGAVSCAYLQHYLEKGVDKKEVYTAAHNLLSSFWNFSDRSAPFRLALAKAGGLKLMVNYLEERSKVSDSDQTAKEKYIIFVVINTVYNMSRSIELKAEFLSLDAENVLKQYLGVSELVKSIVVLCLAHILSDTPEATNLAHEQNVVPTIVQYIKIAMDRPDRMCILVVKSSNMMSVCYSLEELVEGLALLAVNDSIKQTLIENGICNIISYLLKSEAPNLENLGVDLMWTMCFEPQARSHVLESDLDLVASLRALTTLTTTTAEVRRNSVKALTFIEKWENKVAEAEATGKEAEESGRKSAAAKDGHIFLSYSWKQQPTVLRIKNSLTSNGYSVWMDVDKMHGDLLDAMAEAIEKASIVLICFSSTYKQSNPCRTEAQYAHALSKPIVPINLEYHYFPDGWLGIMVRSRKFIDMSLEKRPFDEAFDMLIRELKAFGNDAAEPVADKPIAEPQPQREAIGGGHSTTVHEYPSLPPVTRTKNFAAWTCEDVQNWVKRENLEEFVSTFAAFDGKMMMALYSMKSTAPDFYYKTVSKHHNGSLQGLLKLLAALDQLWLE